MAANIDALNIAWEVLRDAVVIGDPPRLQAIGARPTLAEPSFRVATPNGIVLLVTELRVDPNG